MASNYSACQIHTPWRLLRRGPWRRVCVCLWRCPQVLGQGQALRPNALVFLILTPSTPKHLLFRPAHRETWVTHALRKYALSALMTGRLDSKGSTWFGQNYDAAAWLLARSRSGFKISMSPLNFLWERILMKSHFHQLLFNDLITTHTDWN
jgi:hypothetical protein